MGQGYYFDPDGQRRFTGDIAETPFITLMVLCTHIYNFIFKRFLDHRNNVLAANVNSLTFYMITISCLEGKNGGLLVTGLSYGELKNAYIN